MGAWAQDAVDLVEPGYFEFAEDNLGEFVFDDLKGWLDVRVSMRRPFLEYSWQGISEGDDYCGRGWFLGNIFMAISETSNLAVLIAADNAQVSAITEILGEVGKYGTATVKRAYGDWTTPRLTSWKNVLHIHAVQPIQQFSYTKGKNATDSALIIDAMDLLHGGKVDGFCLVSSDSDFTRLATRIREAGLAVYGFSGSGGSVVHLYVRARDA